MKRHFTVSVEISEEEHARIFGASTLNADVSTDGVLTEEVFENALDLLCKEKPVTLFPTVRVSNVDRFKKALREAVDTLYVEEKIYYPFGGIEIFHDESVPPNEFHVYEGNKLISIGKI